MTEVAKTRMIGIDLIRGVSMVYIVGFWHMFDYTDAFPDYKNAVSSRFIYIVLGTFVFVSGYLIGRGRLEFSREGLATFYRKKLLRIYPLYLLALLLFFAFGVADLGRVMRAGVLLSMLVKPAPLTLWFITMLLLYYLISPLIVYAVRGNRIKELIGVTVVVAALLLVYGSLTGLLDARVLLYLPSFMLGVYWGVSKAPRVRFSFWWALLGVVGILVSLIEKDTRTTYWLAHAPLVTWGAVLLAGLGQAVGGLSPRTTRVVLLLSYASFCMYLFHRPVFSALQGLYFPETGAAQIAYLVGVCLPVTVVVAYLVQCGYDWLLDSIAK